MVGGGIRQLFILRQVANRVETKAVDTHVFEPEGGDLFGLRTYGGRVVVEVWHLVPENGVVVLSVTSLIPGFGTPGTKVARISFAPDIPVAIITHRR